MIKKCKMTWAIFLLSFCLPFSASATDIFVISHKDLVLDPAQIGDIFLGEIRFSKSVRLVPADNHSLRNSFLEKVLNWKPSRYEAYWMRKSFSEGIPTPSLKETDAEIIEFVKTTRGGVGYISSSPKNTEPLNLVRKF